MTWSVFYIVVAGLVLFVLALIAIPIVRKQNAVQSVTQTNVEVVRQRLAELDREVSEGLITEHDKRQAADELKLALVDEVQDSKAGKAGAALPLLVGAIVAILASGIVYYNVNQLNSMHQAQEAIDRLPELSEKLASGNAGDITPQDVSQLALAIRTRLRTQPDDAQGWMFLGRLWTSVGQAEQSIDAFEKAVSLSPEDLTLKVNYAQVLMMTNQEEALKRSQSLLREVLANVPDNDNLSLLMAVVSAQLGDLPNATQYFEKIESKLPASNPMLGQLRSRIAELRGEIQPVDDKSLQKTNGSNDATAFTITVDVSDAMKEKVPSDGFLFVFAQDADSENRMPAAVVKLPLPAFPAEVELNIANAMLPNYTLAQLKNARLVARISVDDSVTTTPGELQGQVMSAVIDGQSVSQHITIDKELQ